MELALAVMMALGIFVAIPAIIGLTVSGIALLQYRHTRKVEDRKTLMETLEAMEQIAATANNTQGADKETQEEIKEPVRIG